MDSIFPLAQVLSSIMVAVVALAGQLVNEWVLDKLIGHREFRMCTACQTTQWSHICSRKGRKVAGLLAPTGPYAMQSGSL